MDKSYTNQLLKKIPSLLSLSNDVDDSLEKIIAEIKTTLNLENVALYYLSDENASLKVPEKNEKFGDFVLNKDTLEKLESNEFVTVVLMDNTNKKELFYLFPLKIRQTIFGFICVLAEEEFNEELVDALIVLASVASYAIKDSELSNVFKIQLKALQSSIVDKSEAVKTIKEQNEKILEADKAKNEFIANISHELRTPLNAIIGFSEVLGAKIFGELNEKQAEYINDIYTSGVHLLGMINEILDISKLESNAMKLTYTEFDLGSAINEVLRVMEPLANKKTISVTFENTVSKIVKLDYQKLQQIFYNLISNAIKFTPNNGSIVLSATQVDNTIHLSVKDSGMGVPKSAQDKIFDKFVQLENTYTKTGSSTGLGLTITKRFVEMMNGTIRLESEEGKGANFIITLPAEPSDA